MRIVFVPRAPWLWSGAGSVVVALLGACASVVGLSHAVVAQAEPLPAEEAAGGRVPELRLVKRSLAMLEEPAPDVDTTDEPDQEKADDVASKVASSDRANKGKARDGARGVESVAAGEIPRAALRAELERGIGRFLRQVRTKPAIVRGRFAGWRLVELFKKRPEIRVRRLRAGDTVTRVNGRSLERPEQLKYVWDSLATAPELVIEIERDSRRCQLHYAIVD